MFNSDDIHVTRRLAEEGLLVVIQPKTKIEWRPFEEARKFARSLGLKGQKEWYEYAKSDKKPKDIPYTPNEVYRKEWKGMGDWLGTGNISCKNKVFRPFKEARKFVRSLGLKSQKDWRVYSKSEEKPEDIPSNPNTVYKKEWKGFGDWLGTGTIANFNKVFRSFKESRKFIRSLRLKSEREWRTYAKSNKRPKDIPSRPNKTYKEEWKGMGDWLGTGNISFKNKVFRPFKEARKFVRSLRLKGHKDWCEYSKSGKRPEDIPSHPRETYKEEWKGFGDWLGTGNIANFNKKFRSFKEGRKFARSLGLKSFGEWGAYCKSNKRPKDIPAAPWRTYEREWKGTKDWLGTE